MIYLLLGIIIGLLLNPAKRIVEEKTPELIEKIPRGKARFVKSVSDKEQFDRAENISDLIN